MSNMYGMMLARHKAFPEVKVGRDCRDILIMFQRNGLGGLPPLVALTSEESHYSIVKGANWLGLGVDNVVKVATDAGELARN